VDLPDRSLDLARPGIAPPLRTGVHGLVVYEATPTRPTTVRTQFRRGAVTSTDDRIARIRAHTT